MPRPLLVVVLAVLLVGLAYAAFSPKLFPYDGRPGAPVGQTLGFIAGILMVASLLYLPAKRGDALAMPNRRLVLVHVLVGSVGAALALAHSRLVVTRPPILVLVAFLGLLGTGLYGRIVASQRMGSTFGRGGHPFRPGGRHPDELRVFVERKEALLARFDPGSREATFALSLRHWARHPLLATRYYALSLVERQRMRELAAAGYRERMGVLERLWRVGHLVLAWLAILGLVAHVVTTLFFAGFAAGGREVYWWHVRR
jgi:hypothetical protein